MNSQIYKQSHNVSVYLSTPKGEIGTEAIVRDIFETGKKCYIPLWDKNKMVKKDG